MEINIYLCSYLKTQRKKKKYEELCSKFRDLIRSITKNPDNYDKKYMKIKFDSDDSLPINKTKEFSYNDNSC